MPTLHTALSDTYDRKICNVVDIFLMTSLISIHLPIKAIFSVFDP